MIEQIISKYNSIYPIFKVRDFKLGKYLGKNSANYDTYDNLDYYPCIIRINYPMIIYIITVVYIF